MQQLETKRLVIRTFTPEDWRDVLELSIDWKSAPGPEFDKWPVTEKECKGLSEHFAREDKYLAVCLRDTKKVIGLIALNSSDTNKQLEVGHVFLSKYQDNDTDREALALVLDYAFRIKEAASILTNNDPEHKKQLAPLKSLGFKKVNESNKGQFALARSDWRK